MRIRIPGIRAGALTIILACLPTGPAYPAQSTTGAAADAGAIQKVFAAYRTALLQKDGAAAANLVSANTLQYYGRMKQFALYASESRVRSLSIMDKIMVLRARHQIGLRKLKPMTARLFLAHGVKMDWIDSQSVSRLTPGAIEVTGERATVNVLRDGKPLPLAFTFVRENSRWKIDLTSIFPIGNAAFKSLISEGESEDRFILDLLETVSGKKPSPKIWQPLVRR